MAIKQLSPEQVRTWSLEQKDRWWLENVHHAHRPDGEAQRIQGFSSIHPSARWAMLAGGVLGVVFEWANVRMKGKFPLSGVGIGLATVVTFPDCLSMGLGALVFWFFGSRLKQPGTKPHRILVENRETLCAGVIAGGALIGIILILMETAVLK